LRCPIHRYADAVPSLTLETTQGSHFHGCRGDYHNQAIRLAVGCYIRRRWVGGRSAGLFWTVTRCARRWMTAVDCLDLFLPGPAVWSCPYSAVCVACIGTINVHCGILWSADCGRSGRNFRAAKLPNRGALGAERVLYFSFFIFSLGNFTPEAKPRPAGQ